MQSVLIVGNSSYAELIHDYLSDDPEIFVQAFTVDGKYINKEVLNGKFVIPFENVSEIYPPESNKLVLAIGYTQLGELRKKLYYQYKGLGYKFINYIHPSAQIAENVRFIGDANIVLEGVTMQKKIEIGFGNLFWTNSVIMHDVKIGSFNTFCACSVLNGKVCISDCVFLGSNSTVRDNVNIANNVLVGAGAYVKKNLNSNCFVAPVSSVILEGEASIRAKNI